MSGELGERLAWYRRNVRAIEQWLNRNPPPALWEPEEPEFKRRLSWAYTEMPDPESTVGRILLALGV